MIVKAYGTRGSVPVSGRNKSKYGGNTTAYRIRSSRVSDQCEIMIDAGSGAIPAVEEMDLRRINTVYILFTHYHQDHILGLGLCPIMFMKNIRKKIFGPKDQEKGPLEAIRYWFQKPFFPVTDEQIKSSFENLMDNGIASNHVLCFHKELCASILLSKYEEIVKNPNGQVPFERNGSKINVSLNDVLFVRNQEVSHPDRCVSYRFEEYRVINNEVVELESCFVLLTDAEAQPALPAFIGNHIKGANLVAVDCQYSNEDYEKNAGFGHGNPAWVATIAEKTKVPHVGIIHHDPSSTDDKVDAIVTQCREIAEKKGVNLKQQKIFGIKDYDEFTV